MHSCGAEGRVDPKAVNQKQKQKKLNPEPAALQMACSKSGHLMELKRRKTFETNNEKMIRKV